MTVFSLVLIRKRCTSTAHVTKLAIIESGVEGQCLCLNPCGIKRANSFSLSFFERMRSLFFSDRKREKANSPSETPHWIVRWDSATVNRRTMRTVIYARGDTVGSTKSVLSPEYDFRACENKSNFFEYFRKLFVFSNLIIGS